MLINKFHEEPQFNAIHSIKKTRFSLLGYHHVFYLFMMIFHISVAESINRDRLKNLQTEENTSISIYQHQGKTNSSEISLSRKLDRNNESLDLLTNSSFNASSVELENTDNTSVFFEPTNSSKQESLVIDLGQQSSYFKENNNNSFPIDNSIIMPFLNAFNSTNIETQQPESYYDYLYELAMNMSHIQGTDVDDSQCQHNFNVSLNQSIFSIKGHIPGMQKPYLGCDWANLSMIQKEHYLGAMQGPKQRFPHGQAIPLTIYYGTLMAIGIPGNLLTCFIITTNSYMRTPPNFFLLNLAVTDLLTLSMIPIEILLFWKHYPWPLGALGCAVASILSELVTYVSIGTMVCFTMERYTAICHPLKPSLHSGKRKTLWIIASIWIVCIVPSALWLIYAKVQYLFYSPLDDDRFGGIDEEKSFNDQGYVKIEESATCMIAETSVTSTMLTITGTTFFVLYLVPIIVLPIIYSRISKAMSDSEAFASTSTGYRQSSDTAGVAENRNRKTVVRIQMAVIVCFLICWTPYHIERIVFVIANTRNKWKTFHDLHETLHVISGCCYFLSSVINPFLYGLLSKRFRRGYHDLVRNTKKLFWAFPIFSRLKPKQSNRDAPSRDNEINIGRNEPIFTNESHQEDDCLISNICCTCNVLRFIKGMRNANLIPSSSAIINVELEQDNGQNEMSVGRLNIEMEEIPESVVLINRERANDTSLVKRTKIIDKTNHTIDGRLSVTPDLIREVFSHSEENESTKQHNHVRQSQSFDDMIFHNCCK